MQAITKRRPVLYDDYRATIMGEDNDGELLIVIKNKTDLTLVLEYPHTEDFEPVCIYIEANNIKKLSDFEVGINWMQAIRQNNFLIWTVVL